MMHKTIVILLLFISLTNAQIRDGKSKLVNSTRINPISIEAVPCFIDDTAQVDLFIFVRINPSFLFFVKSDNSSKETYQANGELVLEIFDEKDIPIARNFYPLQVESNTIPSDESSPIQDIQRAFNFRLKKGSFKIIFEAKDIVSGKSIINRNTEIPNQNFSLLNLNISPGIFVESQTKDALHLHKEEYSTSSRSGNILFGYDGGYLFQIFTHDSVKEITLAWNLESVNEIDEENILKFQGTTFQQQFCSTPPVDNLIQISSTPNIESRFSRFLFIPLPLKHLEPGTFKLDLSISQGLDTVKKELEFNIVWDQKPISLDDFRIAVDALKHIASEDEIQQMSSFSTRKSKHAFSNFWKKLNPDTSRAFNPKMAEYYRRVDASIKRFSVGNDPDGYRTDRGRIYILFGSPSFTNRIFKPNSAPTEIWTYEKLKKRFIFTDQQKTGNYQLKKAEDY